MADNKSKPNYSPSSSEDDEEEVSGSEEGEEEESSGSEISESDSDQKQPKKPVIESSQAAVVKPPPPDLSESEEEEEEEEESGSEEEEEEEESPVQKQVIVDSSIKPISSKPMEPEPEPEPAKKAAVKRSAPVPVPPVEKDLKKAKTSASAGANNAADDDTKKQLFQRLWSEEDEIVILKGMIDYRNEKNESPSGDMGAFHELIKKSLHVDVSRAQLVDKIRRLKKKFVNNVGREKNGKDRMFSKSHEQKGYELSKLIWGSESKKNASGNGNNNKGKVNVASASTSKGVKSNGLDEKDVSMTDVEKSMDISRFVQFGRNNGPVLTDEIMKGGFESLEGSERVEIEEKWKELKKQELELFVKRMDLLKEQAVRVLEAVNSSRN